MIKHYRLVDKYKNNSPNIQSQSGWPVSLSFRPEEMVVVDDPETGRKKSRRIKYSSEESTIYEDEQTGRYTSTPIVFHDGDLFVDSDMAPELVHYMSNSNRNASNPNRNTGKRAIFREVNEMKDKSQKVDNLANFASMVQDIVALSAEDTKIIGRGMSLMGSVEEIRLELIDMAKKSPTKLKAAMANKSGQMYGKFVLATESGLLTHNSKARVVKDGKGKEVFNYAANQEIEDALASFLESEAGQKLYTFLNKHFK